MGKAELPTASKLDATAAHGLVTEYEHDWVAVCQDVKANEKDRLNDAVPPPQSAAPAQDGLDAADPPQPAVLAQDSLDDVAPPPVSAVLAQDSLEDAVPAPQSAELAQDRL